MIEPLDRSVVIPRVKVFDRISLDLLIRAFLWSKLIHEVILFLDTKVLEPSSNVFFDDIERNLDLFLHFRVFALFGVVKKILNAP